MCVLARCRGWGARAGSCGRELDAQVQWLRVGAPVTLGDPLADASPSSAGTLVLAGQTPPAAPHAASHSSRSPPELQASPSTCCRLQEPLASEGEPGLQGSAGPRRAETSPVSAFHPGAALSPLQPSYSQKFLSFHFLPHFFGLFPSPCPGLPSLHFPTWVLRLVAGPFSLRSWPRCLRDSAEGSLEAPRVLLSVRFKGLWLLVGPI